MNFDILSNLVITKIRSVSNLYSPENKGTKRTDRSCWAIVTKYEGETIYTSGNNQYFSDKDHFIILPKGCTYDWLCVSAGHFCIVEFECEVTYTDIISIHVKNGEKIIKMFKELERKRNLKSPMNELESIHDTYSIILALAKAQTEQYRPSKQQQKIAPALEYISVHYNENITNDTLAAVSNMSTVYFRKLFTSTMGVSPITYVHQFRIKKAKEMLRSDFTSLSDVAQSLGYSSLYDFSRDFKKHTGVAPSKY